MTFASILADLPSFFGPFIPFRIAIVAVSFAACGIEAQERVLLYTAEITGVEDEDLREILEGLSTTVQKQAAPPASVAQLHRRAETDIERFLAAFQALGYYAARVEFEISEDADPVHLIFTADPGPQYMLQEISIVAAEGAPVIPLPAPADLGLQPEMPALSQSIVEAQARLAERLQNAGYPYAEVADREAIVDHADKTMDVTFTVAPGPQAEFGELRIEGIEHVRERYLERLVPWEPGQRYSRSELDVARERMFGSGLFSTAEIYPAEEVGEDGRVPIDVIVTERPRRTIGAGLSFSTDEGPGAEVLWEHRNLDGLGRQLRLEARASTLLSQLRAEYRLPYFRRLGQSLVYSFEIAYEDTDAYDSSRIENVVRIDSELNELQDMSYGVGLRFSTVEQQEFEDDYALLFFPVSWSRDTSDDPLDPTRGSRIRLSVTPFLNVSEVNKPFLKAEALWSQYITLAEDPQWILALRGRAGFISAQERDDVPPDVRFYAGGGGSIRGFPYQSAGPLVDEDEPI
ncbi:MAG: BamA/TamA family outer membrane protein, partial [Candidatus Hydrogenedentales bacterium]